VLTTSIGHCEDYLSTVAATIRNPKLWWPHAPHLYDVTFELRSGDVVLDRVHSYFGFRTVGTEGKDVLLNGKRMYLKFVLDQGYWPQSNMTPPSDEAIQYDIRMTKEFGFNGARKHQKIEDPRFYYWADKMGILVSAEMANAYQFDEGSVGRLTREWIEALERDYNHPSVVIWVPLNESWGVPNLRDSRQQHHLRAMYALTRSLDSTRLVIDNDGWEHTEMTDLFAIHDYTTDGVLFYERFKDVGKAGVPIPGFATPVLCQGCSYNGAPVYLSEFGGIAFNPPDNPIPVNSWGYSGVEKTAEEATIRMRGLYEAISRIPGFCGVCYTQLVDVEQEINGLLTYDRRLKYDPAEIRKINALLP
jgi:beta-galactosidase/beta-glucuronidase